MAILKFNDIGIRAITACVPKKIFSNHDLDYLLSKEDIENVILSTGIEDKRYADDDVCTSDLCFKAAEKLIEDNNIDSIEIDALIFVTQTPDFHQPATAMYIQNKLGLSKKTLSFDINLACSGYVYGLSIAYSLANNEGINNVLLLTGDTLSKVISRKDKASLPLFGDAGTATLISKGDFGESFFSLNSDGNGSSIIKIPSGGYRNPSSIKSFDVLVDENGNERNAEQFNMDGFEVFNFGLREVAKDIKFLLSEVNIEIGGIDLIIFHQANKYMTDLITKKLKFDISKVPYSLSKFGNTSSASIPLTICSEMSDIIKYTIRNKVVISGFGAGLSWGTAIINLSKSKVSRIIEY